MCHRRRRRLCPTATCIPVSHGMCCPPALTCHPPSLCHCPLCAAAAAAALYVPLPPHSRCPHLPPFATTCSSATHVPPAFQAPLPHTQVPPHSDGPPLPTRFPRAQTPPTARLRPTPTYGVAATLVGIHLWHVQLKVQSKPVVVDLCPV